MGQLELVIPPDARYVGLARLLVTLAARQCGMVEQRVDDLRIAVSEATANAVLAHRRAGNAAPVELTFGPDERDGFSVTIADTGPGFEPERPDALAARDLTVEGGLGVTLIRGLADAVEFVRGEGMLVAMRFAIGLDAEVGLDGEPT